MNKNKNSLKHYIYTTENEMQNRDVLSLYNISVYESNILFNAKVSYQILLEQSSELDLILSNV